MPADSIRQRLTSVAGPARALILKTFLSPGDLCTLTAAIESLHQSYPGQFKTDIRTSCDELFLADPRVTPLREDEAELLEMHYTDLLHDADTVPHSFLQGYCYDLGKHLRLPLTLKTNRPHLYLTEEERAGPPLKDSKYSLSSRFWLVCAGVKADFTLKQWPVEYYQSVVDYFRGVISFVQIGSDEHHHPPLQGVINLIGKTSIRQLMRLAHDADGGLGPVTLLQHLCAAFEKPYVALLGGREPVTWTQYPLQTTLHTLGRLPCCRFRACWRSRVVALDDGSEQDHNLCDLPFFGMQRAVGSCMRMIEPTEAIRAIEGYMATKLKLMPMTQGYGANDNIRGVQGG